MRAHKEKKINFVFSKLPCLFFLVFSQYLLSPLYILFSLPLGATPVILHLNIFFLVNGETTTSVAINQRAWKLVSNLEIFEGLRKEVGSSATGGDVTHPQILE